jgi:hypothetical protein
MPSRKTPPAAAKKTAAARPRPSTRTKPAAAVESENENRSEEVMVVPPAEDEPVRLGGHILTENGWVVEDLVNEPAGDESEVATPDQGQE